MGLLPLLATAYITGDGSMIQGRQRRPVCNARARERGGRRWTWSFGVFRLRWPPCNGLQSKEAMASNLLAGLGDRNEKTCSKNGSAPLGTGHGYQILRILHRARTTAWRADGAGPRPKLPAFRPRAPAGEFEEAPNQLALLSSQELIFMGISCVVAVPRTEAGCFDGPEGVPI